MDFIRPLIPAPYRIAILLCVLLGIWLHGYHKGSSSNAAEIASLTAVGAAQDAQYRRMEKETQNALQTLVGSYRAAAADRDKFWMRLQASAREVPRDSPTASGPPEADGGRGLEVVGGEGGRPLPQLRDDIIQALRVGEQCQADLQAYKDWASLIRR